ncbi:pectate lyase [Algoriphagus jejuensis]|uniref:Pectate lyase n=1 Tax=Algoriphagus jejuensis TaxID=419934 RepID=A0ABN1MZH9_9BACT
MKLFPTLLLFFQFAFLCGAFAQDQIPQKLAFPGAEGFGKYTTGGRGGKVFVVTSLADDGPGTLRKAIQKKEPRIIVFAVSGTIDLESSLDINYGDLTIAGQSAPGGGITLKNFPLKIKANNVIIRYIRSRMGDLHQVQDDAISAIRTKDVIIDHCSLSWATDECGSFYDNENFTLQNSILSESLNRSVHEKGEHGYGGIWGGMKASFLYNLLSDHNSRNPRFNGARYHKMPKKELGDFRNNVIYNWSGNSSYAGEEGNYNMVNNYYKPGPATPEKHVWILEPYAPYGRFFISGNVVEGFSEMSQNNSLGVVHTKEGWSLLDEELENAAAKTFSADEALEFVLENAGARLSRDAVDLRVIDEIKSGKETFGQSGIIDTQEQVGGWPILDQKEAPIDSDQDGMPDDWEKGRELNPQSALDAAQFDLDSNYTNVEIYLNGLIAGN